MLLPAEKKVNSLLDRSTFVSKSPSLIPPKGMLPVDCTSNSFTSVLYLTEFSATGLCAVEPLGNCMSCNPVNCKLPAPTPNPTSFAGVEVISVLNLNSSRFTEPVPLPRKSIPAFVSVVCNVESLICIPSISALSKFAVRHCLFALPKLLNVLELGKRLSVKSIEKLIVSPGASPKLIPLPAMVASPLIVTF